MSKRTVLASVFTPLAVLAISGGIIGGAAFIPAKKIYDAASMVFSSDTKHQTISEIKYVEKEVEAELDDGNKIVYPSFGKQYATLKIDSIKLEAPVFFGSTPDLLHEGVCQYIGSVVIGETGNVVLDAHCNTYFLDLEDVKEGDEIVLTTSYGEFKYKAKKITYFKDSDNTLIAPSQEDKLTLYTCYGNLLGPTEDRLAVICEPIEKKFKE